MKLIFFILRTKQTYKKLSAVSERAFKIKTMSDQTIFEILFTSALCKQRLLHGNEMVQYLQNYKCYNVSFRNTLQSFTNDLKKDYPKTAHKFFLDCLSFSYSLRLLESALWFRKTSKTSQSYSHPVRNNDPLKISENYFFVYVLLINMKNKVLSFLLAK